MPHPHALVGWAFTIDFNFKASHSAHSAENTSKPGIATEENKDTTD